MRILLLGGDGMLGHRLCLLLRDHFEVWATFRGLPDPWIQFSGLAKEHAIGDVDATDFASVERALAQVRPEAALNAIGIVKQREEAHQTIPAILVNSLFPHLLADSCQNQGTRLVHLSTDCVFSGRGGDYSEDDIPDPVDLYGRSKLLGEVDRPGVVTLRTSIVGWEIKGHLSLLEWFAAHRGQTIDGFTRAVFSGITTTAVATLVQTILESEPDLSGLYHAASEPIDKYSLLNTLSGALGWTDTTIRPTEGPACDRSLSPKRLAAATGWVAPSWGDMCAQLAAEWPTYDQWRQA